MLKFALIAAGGAVGAVLRYSLAGWAQKLISSSIPVGTLFVNVFGCLLMGLLAGFFAGPHLMREEYRVGLMVGVLGAFTTFSTFGWETFALANDGQIRLAVVNVMLSNCVGLVAVWFGYRMGEQWFGA